MVTPIEIRQHTFKKAFQGYNKDDVHHYLNNLSLEWERMVEDHKRVKTELEKTSSALDNLRQVESALHKTLLQAEETSKSTIENAKTTADLRIHEAEAMAKDMLKTAMEDRSRIEMQINELVSRRNEILNQLKSYLTAQTERLKTFEEKEMKMPVITPMEVRTGMQPRAEQAVEVNTVQNQQSEPQENAAQNANENKSFFEKSVVSSSVSTVINDIADEL